MCLILLALGMVSSCVDGDWTPFRRNYRRNRVTTEVTIRPVPLRGVPHEALADPAGLVEGRSPTPGRDPGIRASLWGSPVASRGDSYDSALA